MKTEILDLSEILTQEHWNFFEGALDNFVTDEEKAQNRIDQIKDPWEAMAAAVQHSLMTEGWEDKYLSLAADMELLFPGRLPQEYKGDRFWQYLKDQIDLATEGNGYGSHIIDNGILAKILYPDRYQERYLGDDRYIKLLLFENSRYHPHTSTLSELLWLMPSLVGEIDVSERQWDQMLKAYVIDSHRDNRWFQNSASEMRIISEVCRFDFPDEDKFKFVSHLYDLEYQTYEQQKQLMREMYLGGLRDRTLSLAGVASMGLDLKIVEAESLVLTDQDIQIITPAYTRTERRLRIVGDE